jgi:hypothetical protein
LTGGAAAHSGARVREWAIQQDWGDGRSDEQAQGILVVGLGVLAGEFGG